MKNLLERLKGKLKSVPKLVYGIVAALVTFIVVMLVMIFTPLNSGDNGSSNSSYVKEIDHSGNEKKKEKEDTTKKADEKKSEEKKDDKKDDKKTSEDTKASEEKTNTESVTNTENTSNVTNQPSENVTNNSAVEQPSAPSAQKEKKPIYQTIHHEATGHWETQIISEAYDDPQFEERVVGISSGHIYDSVVDFARNGDLYGDGNYTVTEVQVGSVHHDAVTTQVWVEDSPAHDEQVLVGWE